MKVVEGENQTVELRFQHSDGRWLYFECAVRNLLKLENINGLVFNAREITERKKAEEQLLFSASHVPGILPSVICGDFPSTP